MENSSLKLNKELFNLYHLLSSNVEDYKSQVEKDNVGIELLLEPTNEDLLIEADRNRLSQVISNLLSNAIKFMNEGTVSVAVQMKDSSRVIVSVKDTGTGIDPEILPRLFCKFATISKTGTGLGLLISKNIIEAHGGNIYAENNEGIEGATFYIILPVHAEGDFSTVDELHKITDPGPEYGVTISKLIESCREEQDIDKKVEILYRINSMLPKVHRLKTPSLLTDDYIETALYKIEIITTTAF